jgi:transposase-like protein
MPRRNAKKTRRVYTDEIKQEAVQMLLDGHEPAAILKHLDLPRKNLIYKWKQEQVQDAGPVADSMDTRLRELQAQLHRVERERDILKKALGILGRSD